MTLPIATRNPLIEISAALHAKDSALVQQRIDELPVGVRYRIYERMWHVMGCPMGDDAFGENAFRGSHVPTQKKIEAIEKIIAEEVPLPDSVTPVQPKKSTNVEQTFWDTGFDPRFTADGHFYLVPQRSLRQVISAIAGFVIYYIFIAKSYCGFSREERQVRGAILEGAALEKLWSSYYVRTLVINVDDPSSHWIPQAEHDFLETANYLHQRLIHDSGSPERLFPREVIFPIHRMNKPQDLSEAVDKIQPEMENMDLVRTGPSFARLCKDMYVLEPRSKQKHSFDTLDYDYVPHYLFVHATRESAERLKLACRELRQQIAATTTDLKCAFSFAQCKARLIPALRSFNEAWQGYVQSHEILTEAQVVWSSQDYRRDEYAAFRAEAKMPPAEFAVYKCDKANRVSEQAHDLAEVMLEKDYRERYPNTKTGRLLTARHDVAPTLPDKV
jgi:hypothetical protein